MFEKRIGIQEIEKDKMLKTRDAVRGVIIHHNKLLLVHSNQGDYKFPGGGVEKGENHEEALIREIAEETGYLDSIVKEKAGVVVERHEDIFDNRAIFKMDSHYYFCEVTGGKSDQQLDGYEAEQEYTPRWTAVEEAIKQNEEALAKNPQNRWIHRETYVLKELKNMMVRKMS